MRNALGFLQARGFTEKQQNSIKVTRVSEDGEPTEFKVLFNKWHDANEVKTGFGQVYINNKIAKIGQTHFDPSKLHNNSLTTLDPFNENKLSPDDGKNGIKKVWFINKFDIHELDEKKYGEFHTGDCYIVEYTYKMNNCEKTILYYWIVRISFYYFLKSFLRNFQF
jgi:hypothetical protein